MRSDRKTGHRKYSVAGNIGLPIGTAGFANLSLEHGAAGPTNRAIQRHDARRLVTAGGPTPRDTAQVWGAPRVEGDLKTFANFGADARLGPAALRPCELRTPPFDRRGSTTGTRTHGAESSAARS